MASPTIQILSKKIDSLRTITDSMNESYQSLSVKVDSVYSTASDILGCQSNATQQMDSISTKLNSISEYGIGYSDAVTHLSLPLIIALFAFAFPFLFTVISHINNKYKSEKITKMLSSETSYHCFMGGAIICASYLLLAGFFTYIFRNESYPVFKNVLNWTSIFVSGGYSAVIIWFVYTCINYNSPQKILERIGILYNRNVKSIFKNTIRTERRIYNSEYNRIYRYVDICKYAVDKQEYPLFIGVLQKVNVLKPKTNKLDHLKCEFYEKVLDSYLFGKPNAMMEDSLMMYWFMSFKKSEEPNLGIVFRMLQRVVSAVQQGRSSLFENYLLKSKYGYRYITELTIVSYVRGKDLKEQKSIDKKRREIWRDLRIMHNMAIAHLFSLGYNEVIRIVQLGDNTGYEKLIPGTGIEVLKMFALCKENQLPDGEFNYWACEHVIGENTDPKMLEKYAAIMLLMASTDRYDELRPISPKHLQSIKEAKKDIVRFGNLWKSDVKLKGLFPQIEDVDILELMDDYIRWFEGEEFEETTADNVENKKCLIARVIDALLHKQEKTDNKRVKSDDIIYSKDLLESEKAKIEQGYLNLIRGNRRYVLDGLYGPDGVDKTESEEMGSFTYLMFKDYLVEDKGIDYNFELFGDARVYQSRYMCMLLKAVKNMRIKDDSIHASEIKKYLKKYFGDNGDKYFVINIGTAPLLLLYLDKEDKERRGINDMRIMNATYKSYDFNMSWYMKDHDDLEEFNDTILIIKKTDLPYDYSTSPDFGPKVIFEDLSNKEEGKAEVRVTVNPHLAIRYSKKAEVRRVKIKRMLR